MDLRKKAKNLFHILFFFNQGIDKVSIFAMEVDTVTVNQQVDILSEEQRILLNDKNLLNEVVIEKYRLAGQITQTALLYIENLLLDCINSSPSMEDKRLSVGEICRLGTKFLQQLVDGVFRKSVQEKGIAIPVRLEKGEFVDGVSPEEGDKFQGGFLEDGDIVKIVLGVYIDGYTAQASHTVVVRDYAEISQPETPLEGSAADSVCAAYIATEALIGLLGITVSSQDAVKATVGKVNGTRIRWLVDTVAKAFKVQVVPGSRVRRIRRFLAGQDTVVEESDFKGVVWGALADESDTLDDAIAQEEEEIEAVPGEAWLIDIQMAATSGKRGVVALREFQGYDSILIPSPTIFSRDFSIHYGLKLNASRGLLARTNALASVYPFKLSQVSDSPAELRSSKLGLKENLNHHILVPHPIMTAEFIDSTGASSATNRTTKQLKAATTTIPVAREMTTVVLVPAAVSDMGYGEVLRLTGGAKTGVPAFVHSQFQLQDNDINKLLELLQDKRFGIRVKVVQPSKYKEVSSGALSTEDVMDEDE